MIVTVFRSRLMSGVREEYVVLVVQARSGPRGGPGLTS